jgi:hypothetical protein
MNIARASHSRINDINDTFNGLVSVPLARFPFVSLDFVALAAFITLAADGYFPGTAIPSTAPGSFGGVRTSSARTISYASFVGT